MSAENSINVVGALAAAPVAGDNSQALVWKTSASAALGLAGLYYVFSGKKDQDLKSMLLGGALILLAALVF